MVTRAISSTGTPPNPALDARQAAGLDHMPGRLAIDAASAQVAADIYQAPRGRTRRDRLSHRRVSRRVVARQPRRTQGGRPRPVGLRRPTDPALAGSHLTAAAPKLADARGTQPANEPVEASLLRRGSGVSRTVASERQTAARHAAAGEYADSRTPLQWPEAASNRAKPVARR
jgi:hypothetical protein